ncbi:MAG: type II toxin-antitoxin system VapC family toxin [Acidobacteriia bacterium]|nr:type II toxin-antitoxin system VapC family toxin [Terriglobia bacterium]
MKRPVAVVDASVAIKWLLPEEDQEIAYRLQDQYQDGAIDLIAPELLLSEVGNALWKRVRRRELTPSAAGILFDGLLRDVPILVNSVAIHRRALSLSLESDRPIYDCEYLALALDHRCDLVTADARFYQAVRQAWPRVKLLRDMG